MIFIASV